MTQDFTFGISREEWHKRWFARSLNSGELSIKAIKWFDKYILGLSMNEAEIIAQLTKVKEEPAFYQFLDNFIQYLLANHLSPGTIPTYFSFVKDYLRAKGFRIYNEDVKQFIHFPKHIREKREPVTMESISILYSNATPKMKAIISFALSTGMRITEILLAILSDIESTKVSVRAETTKTKVDRITYMSKQAQADLMLIINDKQPTDHIFVKQYTPQHTLIALEKEFNLLRKKCELTKQYRLTRNHHITIHRFRAFCKTMASEVCGQDFAEGLVGHEGYLSTYYALPEAQRYKNYQKLEPFLTIPTNEKQMAEYNKSIEKLNDFKAKQLSNNSTRGNFNHG